MADAAARPRCCERLDADAASRSRSTTSAPATRRSAYLRKLPVRELKIDKSFVIGMGGDGNGEEDKVIVRSTSDLGHNLGLRWWPRESRTRRPATCWSSFGCDAGAGLLHGAADGGPDLAAWLREH